MQRFENLVLIGTSHIAKQSLVEVEETIIKEKPDVVALELDKDRFYALLNKERGRLELKHISRIGFKGYLFAKFGEYIERKLGNKVGVSPGDEMLKAAEVAKNNNCKVAFIDQKIEVTLKNFSKELTWKEKFRFVVDIIKGVFNKGEKVNFDLSKVPEKEFIRKILTQVKERYPNFYKVLVADRNKFMAHKLVILMKNYNSVVGVVGAGHEEEIIEEIKLLLGKQN